jgi:hypothetical protein
VLPWHAEDPGFSLQCRKKKIEGRIFGMREKTKGRQEGYKRREGRAGVI